MIYEGKKCMESNLEKYKKDLEHLISCGGTLEMKMTVDLLFNDVAGQDQDVEILDYFTKANEDLKNYDFKNQYEKWYTLCLEVIKQLIPDRFDDFKILYKNGKRKTISHETYTLSDYMIGLIHKTGYYTQQSALPKLQQQRGILESARSRLKNTIFDIKQLLQADLFDSEIDMSRELLRKGFLRAAGVISGVVLERHLAQVCENHAIKQTKKKPTISNYNDKLKEHNAYDVSTFRQVQFLADVRNICSHEKDEPTKESVEKLIRGVDEIIRTIF